MIAIEPDVVEGRGILRPHQGSGNVGNDIGEIGAVRKVADVDGVELRAGFVGRPGEQLMVRRVPGRSEMKIRLAVREFVAFARTSKEKLNFGGSLATPPQLMGLLFNKINGLDIVYVPYKGAAPSLADLVSARTHMAFDGLVTLHPLIREGKLRPLAVTGATRSPTLPDVPTMIESGYPDFPQDPWAGLLAPAGTPKDVVARLNITINDALQMKDVRARLMGAGIEIQGGTPVAFAEVIRTEVEKWGRVVKQAGIPQQ